MNCLSFLKNPLAPAEYIPKSNNLISISIKPIPPPIAARNPRPLPTRLNTMSIFVVIIKQDPQPEILYGICY